MCIEQVAYSGNIGEFPWVMEQKSNDVFSYIYIRQICKMKLAQQYNQYFKIIYYHHRAFNIVTILLCLVVAKKVCIEREIELCIFFGMPNI